MVGLGQPESKALVLDSSLAYLACDSDRFSHRDTASDCRGSTTCHNSIQAHSSWALELSPIQHTPTSGLFVPAHNLRKITTISRKRFKGRQHEGGFARIQSRKPGSNGFQAAPKLRNDFAQTSL